MTNSNAVSRVSFSALLYETAYPYFNFQFSISDLR